jgi:hypothetical protein
MAEYTDLRIDVNSHLGLKYNTYKNKIYKLALTDPESYYTLREEVEKSIQTDAISALYTTIYNALKDGTKVDGSNLGDTVNLPVPCVPVAKVNQICIDLCQTLNEILTEQVLELLLPIDYNKIMSSRLGDKGKAQTLGDI